MRTSILGVIACVSALALLGGCAKEKPVEQIAKPETKVVRLAEKSSFKFTTTGTSAGAVDKWEVNLDAAGKFTIMRTQGNQAGYLGTYTLPEKRNLALWEMIRGAFAGDIKSAGGQGKAGETKYTFIITDETVGIINLWASDVEKNPNIASLVEEISSIVEENTGEKPEF